MFNRSYLVLSESLDHVLLLNPLDLLLTRGIGKGLRDRVVLNLLVLHVGISHLTVRLLHELQVLLRLLVVLHIVAPRVVVLLKAGLLGQLGYLCVTRHL